VDVQENRLEGEIVGHGEGDRTWSLDYFVIPGRPAETEVWAQLDKILRQPIPAEQGDAFTIAQTCVDSGYLSSQVYQFARSRRAVSATKGTGNPAAPIIGRPAVLDFTHQGRVVKGGVQLWSIGTHQAKLLVYERLRLAKDDADDTPPGYCHFPADYDQHYFQMLTSETLITRMVKGYTQQRWEKIGRNEALDCRVLAIAAAHILGAHRLRPEDWRAMAANRGLTSARQTDLINPPLPEQIRAPQPQGRPAASGGSFIPETGDWF
jgi:phage terminase large subunit GpA-like protein